MLAHHLQETDTTCGPAVMRMALESLAGIRWDEAVLAHALGTDGLGTPQAHLVAFAAANGLSPRVHHGDLGAALRATRRGLVIVCYVVPERGEDHYAILCGLRDGAVELCDPRFGPSHRLPVSEFLARWRCLPVRGPAIDEWWLELGAKGVPQASRTTPPNA